MSGDLSGLQDYLYQQTGTRISDNEIPDLLRKINATARQQIEENQENDHDSPARAEEKAEALSLAYSVDNSMLYLMDLGWDWGTLPSMDRAAVAHAAVDEANRIRHRRRQRQRRRFGIRDGQASLARGTGKRKKSRRRRKPRRKSRKKSRR